MAYNYRRSITIDRTKVSNTDQVSFPVLVSGTYAYLATLANGGNVSNTVSLNGRFVPADLIFTSDSGGNSLLSWEVASYVSSTGAIEVWVNVPTVSASVNTVIYMWYGDATVVNYQCTTASAWNSNYKGVWHLNDNAANTNIIDSIGVNNLTNQRNTNLCTTTGEVSAAINYNGTTDSSGGAMTTLPFPATASGFFRSSATGTFQVIFSHNTSATNNGWRVQIAGGTNTLEFTLGAVADYNFTLLPVSPNTIYYFAVSITGNNGTAKGYLAPIGNALSTQSIAIGTPAGTPDMLILGAVTNTFNGWLDEIHISNVVRNADWITTEYNNQSSPGTFYTIGAETSLVVLTGSGGDSWQRYLTWLQKRKKSEFKRKSGAAGIKEVVAVKIAEAAAKEVLKQERGLSAPFYAHIDEGELLARNAVRESITAVYDEVWKQMAVQKRDIADLKINIKKKQEGDEEDDVFLMVM